VAVTRAMTGERTIQFALLGSVLKPEIEREDGSGKGQEPDHGN